MQRCELLIGARGWSHPAWRPGFYPEDLPPEWELAYYANELRGVLVPVEVLEPAPVAAVESWLDDVPAGFRFFAEVRAPALEAALPRLLALGPALAGVVLLAPDGGEAGMARARQLLPPGVCVSVDGAAGSADVPGLWRPGHDGAGPWGCVGAFESVPATARELRARVEGFLAAAGQHAVTMLCFPGAARSPAAMADARIIAELLGA